jgi:hypothetical protein
VAAPGSVVSSSKPVKGGKRSKAEQPATAKRAKTLKSQDDSDDNMDMPVKAACQSGVVACAICRVRPGPQHLWAQYSSASNGSQAASGDTCAACSKVWASYFGHFAWPQFVAHAATPDGRLNIEQAKTVANTQTPIDWIPDSVDAISAVTVRLERSMVILSAAEYKKEFGKSVPGTRGPKVHVLKLPAEQGGAEVEHYAFADPLLSQCSRSAVVLSRASSATS